MCTSKKKFTRTEVYDVIQTVLACVVFPQSRIWISKHKKPDGSLIFKMGPKLGFGGLNINLVELGGESIGLKSLIDRIYDNEGIIYDDIDFMPYLPNATPSKTNFFNLFLGFKAKPAPQINYNLINPITWHIENIWCNGDKALSEYVLNWIAFLVQYPNKIPGTILVLRSPPRYGKNIITDFIRKSLFGPELVFSTSDLGKILGKFNGCVQGRKLIIMNEAGMLTGEWHKSNDHLKSLITEDYITIEHKGLEPFDCGHFPGFMVLSNHDAPIRVEQGDGRIVCLDVSLRCKGNFKYFGQLGKILNHPDTPGSFMSYLLDRDLLDWNPEKNIPTTKMKTETMQEHLPNPIRFIIDHISLWSENQVENPSTDLLYQAYRTWCEANGEKPFTNSIFGKKIKMKISIERKRAGSGKREWQYILDQSKIVAKMRESICEIEEFSDTPKDNPPIDSSTGMPIFNVPEITPKPEKDTAEALTPDRNEKGKGTSSAPPFTNMTQELFDSIIDQLESSVASSSKSTNISLPPEIEHVEVIDDKPKSPEIIEESAKNEPEISPVLPVSNESKSNNEAPPQQVSYPPGYQTREQREKRLRETAIKYGEDPDKFMTITEKDKDLSLIFKDKMISDAEMIQFAKDTDDDPDTLMDKDMDRRARLICIEIKIRKHEDDGEFRATPYDDEE
ncbi:hypothetical protein Glove_207g24 [Diversispora epigaea]|uniref:Uncharacterized protein n=1 Tax=Diversispora epigaea TaxID=1348612 RepID=A0A397IJK1_9GLOM|nr:hypothetical protein Glove_207g24 [Diversispora epigaea]